ncbi:MAG: hypothetical protein R2695_02645 [Acidimicrobiales bacterium]
MHRRGPAENNASVHPGNDLVVASGEDSVVLRGVEGAPGKVTTAEATLMLGPVITVTLVMGPDGIFSAGAKADVVLECVPPKHTTTTSSPRPPPLRSPARASRRPPSADDRARDHRPADDRPRHHRTGDDGPLVHDARHVAHRSSDDHDQHVDHDGHDHDGHDHDHHASRPDLGVHRSGRDRLARGGRAGAARHRLPRLHGTTAGPDADRPTDRR